MTKAVYEAKKAILIAEIDRAFDGVERDDKVTEEINDVSVHVAPDKEPLLNAGTNWQQIPDQWIQDDGDRILFYLGAHSFRYYLPACLSWFLRYMDREEDESYKYDMVFHSVWGILTVNERREDFFLKKFALLSQEQSKTVGKFLVFQCERFILLYGQEEFADPESDYEFNGYKGNRSYKDAYHQYQWALTQHWGQFLEGGFVQADFPFTGPSRKWRNMMARRKVIEPQRLAAYEARKQALIAEIERAFDGVEREDGLTLYEASAMDSYAEPEELAEVRLCATETRWQDVPDEDIQYRPMSLIYLDEKGFRYYLPAYLRWYLRYIDYEAEDFHTSTFGSVIHAIEMQSDDGEETHYSAKLSALSNEQKRAIAHFIEFRHEGLDYRIERRNYTPDPEDEEDEKADLAKAHAYIQLSLDNYWGQFLK